ncbi:MAG: hypothetical protein AAFR87_22360 [Bacteroidota bacterium]
MLDSTPKILQKQFEIYQSKSQEDKISMLVDMMEYSINQTMDVLRKWYPEKSPIELKVEFFKHYYKDDFGQKAMDRMLEKIRNEE